MRAGDEKHTSSAARWVWCVRASAARWVWCVRASAARWVWCVRASAARWVWCVPAGDEKHTYLQGGFWSETGA